MKRSVIAQFSQGSSCKYITALLFLSPVFKTNATEFIDILRMTADHPSIQSAVSSTSAAYFDIEQAKAGNSLQFSAGLSSTAYSGQPGYENNPIAPHISISKVLYDHGRTDDTVQGKEAAFSMQRAQVMATRETINQQALTLFTSAVTNAKVVAILDQEIVALNDLLQRVKTIASIDPGRASEINQVATRLNSVVATRESSNTTLQQSWKQLSLLLNRNIVLTSELPDLKQAGLLPESLDIGLKALMDNPTYTVYRYKRDEARAALQLASKWNRPQWNVKLSLDSPRNNGEMEPFKAATLQVSSDINLWDGGSGASAVKGQTQRLASAEQDMDATLRSLQQQLEQLWISLPLRQQQINALKQQSESALKTWKAGEVQFFASQRPLTDLISFATDYYSSLASLEEQKVQYAAAQWQIVAALGKMSDLAKNVPALPGAPLATSAQSRKEQTADAISTFNAQVAANARQNSTLADEKDIEAFKKAVEKTSDTSEGGKLLTAPQNQPQQMALAPVTSHSAPVTAPESKPETAASASTSSTRTPLIVSEPQQSTFILKSQKEANAPQNALRAWPWNG